MKLFSFACIFLTLFLGYIVCLESKPTNWNNKTNGTDAINEPKELETNDVTEEMANDYEQGYLEGRKAAYFEGYKEGKSQGYRRGHSHGVAKGQIEGRKYGRSEGEKNGQRDGYWEGFRDSRAEGLKLGKQAGYTQGEKTGEEYGYSTGLKHGLKIAEAYNENQQPDEQRKIQPNSFQEILEKIQFPADPSSTLFNQKLNLILEDLETHSKTPKDKNLEK
ncbi:hypothetical protein K7432_014440 [Basidiobolus ranarum]|uniref:Essential protein Yae1 N-terminal domain-containing protein n=1 Tax=Basidiobolus ranarum TaxID=34480 RepID=A0ABR2WHM3_9FUNG